jgi:hypothetical protein
MIVYYAIGGGLGHRVRAQRVLDALGIEARIVTNDHLPIDWRSLDAERLIVDAFPCGIQGELADVDIPMDYVARLLQWDDYVRSLGEVTWPRFQTTFIVEELTEAHAAFVQAQSDRVVELRLNVNVGRASARLDHDKAYESAGLKPGLRCFSSYWLIVHSGPESEVRELIDYAHQLKTIENSAAQILVATQCDVEERIDEHPVHHLFADAERIISAAGFNVMLETEPFREKHIVLPFPRRFDDQFTRAARRRRTPSGE